MKKCHLFFVLSILPALITAEKVTTLSQPVNPHKIIVSGNQMIVEDFPKIHIFSLEDFRLQRSFGEKGEAPGEFLPRSGYVRLNIHVRKDFIFVESNGKLSFFSRDGTFLREMNSAAAGYLFQPMGKDKFIGLRNVGEKGTVECFIIDQEGTIQERLFLPLIEENILREYPFDIHNGKVYQLIENEETEHWELHVSGIR